MQVICDIEANGLKPTQIWVIVCKDIDTGELHVFRNVTQNDENREAFLAFAQKVTLWVGHNWLEYDYPVLHKLIGLHIIDVANISLDTLILSRLIDYPRSGHSIEDYGIEFGLEKGDFNDWSKYSLEMEEYCVRDVEICYLIYRKYLRYTTNPLHEHSIRLEHSFQLVVNDLHNNGFAFNIVKAEKLLLKVQEELAVLDKEILDAFPPHLKLIRQIDPVLTQHGTLNRRDFRWVENGDLTEFSGGPFSRCKWETFNPASHKQVIDVLHQAGWKPIDATQTAIDNAREINKLKRSKNKDIALDTRLKELYNKKSSQEKYGWKINENNLATLPRSAPAPARTLAKRILYESRRRTLTEWLNLANPVSGRIHGKFYGIGAWTHRMAHQAPNTANIPNSVHISTGLPKLLGSEMRSLWQAPKNRLLVGVDAEAIQLRIFAHLINDPELTNAIVNGKKSDGTDPHSLNRKVFGKFCKTRNAAKHSLYAIFFGGRANKISQIMACTKEEAEVGIQNLIARYPGLARLEEEVFPNDARRGYFIGLDGRRVRIPGETVGERKHLCMSGYLQNGEKVVMAAASVKFNPLLQQYHSFLVALVHDEWQTETPNDMEIAVKVAKLQTDSLREVGVELKLNCPLAGSYWSDDNDDYTIGTNWKVTH